MKNSTTLRGVVSVALVCGMALLTGILGCSGDEWPLSSGQGSAENTEAPATEPGEVFAAAAESPNYPPYPPIISGPTRVRILKEVSYSVVCGDPDLDSVYYNIHWGDNRETGWFGPYPSGLPVTRTTFWDRLGSKSVSAQAMDIHGVEGTPSDPLLVQVVLFKELSDVNTVDVDAHTTHLD